MLQVSEYFFLKLNSSWETYLSPCSKKKSKETKVSKEVYLSTFTFSLAKQKKYLFMQAQISEPFFSAEMKL